MQVINLFHNLRQLLLICLLLYSTIPSLAAVNFKSLNADNHRAEAIQGGLLIGKTEPGNTIWLDQKKIRVAIDGTFIIGFGREASHANLQIESKKGERKIQVIDVQARRYQIQRIDGLPSTKVNPRGESVIRRIAKETRLVKLARQRDDDREDFKAGFIWPANGPVSGVYGSQRILNGEKKRPHFGLDIAAPIGSPVIAPAAGVVTLVHSDMFFSGGTLIIDHGFGLSSTFLHLSELLVKTGQYVQQASLVAKVGATGRATGPHLDWRVNWFDIRLDPQLLVERRIISKRKNDG